MVYYYSMASQYLSVLDIVLHSICICIAKGKISLSFWIIQRVMDVLVLDLD